MNIPDKCYALNNMTIDPHTKLGDVIIIRALEHGFYSTEAVLTQEDVDSLNVELGVSRWEAKAMEDCSMFNWEMYPNRVRRYSELMEEKQS